jgi:hypothetical protein
MMQNQLFRDLCNVCLFIHSLSLRRLVANESVAFSRAEYKQGMETPTWLFTVELVYSVVAVMGFVQLAGVLSRRSRRARFRRRKS